MTHSDRRRTTFAVVVTLVALPALWLTSRKHPTATRATAGSAAPATSAPAPAATYRPGVPVFLGGDPPPPPPAVIEVDSPPPADGHAFDGKATFQRFGADNACSTRLAPAGKTLTVTNTDNGLSLTCVNGAAVVPPDDTQIVVHTELLATICDLANAPVHVRVSW
jgi:hypothetical protein